MSLPTLEGFKAALEQTVDSVIITDLHSVIRYVNPAFTQITGFTVEEAIGRKPSLLRSRHTTLETYADMWRVILAGGWWRGEIINVRRNGEEWTSFLSISQIKDEQGVPTGYVGIARDITELKRLQQEIREAGLEAIFMLSVACEAKDETTGSHIRRVQAYSEALALRLGLSAAQAEEIGYSSMMHDVGKIHVPDAILRKAGPLSREEWDAMVRHTTAGTRILRDKAFYRVARDICTSHHERWDGQGYPERKRETEIPLAARIVAVADVFDALTTRRPYKDAWPETEALARLANERGLAFDPQVVDAFLQLYEEGVIPAIRRQYPPG